MELLYGNRHKTKTIVLLLVATMFGKLLCRNMLEDFGGGGADFFDERVCVGVGAVWMSCNHDGTVEDVKRLLALIALQIHTAVLVFL